MPDVFLTAAWEQLIMANYRIDPSLLQPHLPHGVELDLFHNEAYVSLVGFMFKDSRIFGVPIPLFGSFEEVNLRFYVKRTLDGIENRGVVFINETVPHRVVAWLANKLYKEHYIAIPTKHAISASGFTQYVRYDWKPYKNWNSLSVHAEKKSGAMAPGSMEEFIFEHYYGYTRVDQAQSQQYSVQHPRWEVHKVMDYHVDCDFMATYGPSFSVLNEQQPHSVFLAAGSPVSINWKRETF
jgi:uncharacterized protein